MFIFLIALLAIFTALYLKNYSRPKNYPPGPFCFPIIGSWYSVPGQGIELKVAEWRKKYGNIIGHKIGNRNLVVIAGYEETVKALKNSNFQNRIHTSTLTHRTFYKVLGLFFGDGEQYNEVRRFTIRFLNQATVDTLESLAYEEMMNFFLTIKSGEIVQVLGIDSTKSKASFHFGQIHVYSDLKCLNSSFKYPKLVDGEFTYFASNILFAYLIGDSIKSLQNEAKTFRDLVYHSFRSGRPSGIENFYPWAGIFFQRKPQFVAVNYAQNFFRNRLKEHRESFDPENIRDYIDAFLLEQEKEKQTGLSQFYTDEELISCLLDMGLASSESTNNTIAFILMYVALHPQVQSEIHQELDSVLGNRLPLMEDKSSLPYCIAVVEETMRINTIAATAVQHIVTEDTRYYGYTIPEGTMIIFPFWDIFRNPDEFDDPASFKPERFVSKEIKSKVISFGLGKRSCVGESVARKTLFLFVTHFFQKYWISLPKGYMHPDTEPLLGFTNCPKAFHLVITERQSE